MTLTGLLPGHCSGLSGEQVGSVSAEALLSDRPHSQIYYSRCCAVQIKIDYTVLPGALQ